jgi:hypothetical protein
MKSKSLRDLIVHCSELDPQLQTHTYAALRECLRSSSPLEPCEPIKGADQGCPVPSTLWAKILGVATFSFARRKHTETGVQWLNAGAPSCTEFERYQPSGMNHTAKGGNRTHDSGTEMGHQRPCSSLLYWPMSSATVHPFGVKVVEQMSVGVIVDCCGAPAFRHFKVRSLKWMVPLRFSKFPFWESLCSRNYQSCLVEGIRKPAQSRRKWNWLIQLGD